VSRCHPQFPTKLENARLNNGCLGVTRAKIASDNNISEGSVTNIVSDLNKGMADSEFESIREFVVESRK
jgi:hypothetical protein